MVRRSWGAGEGVGAGATERGVGASSEGRHRHAPVVSAVVSTRTSWARSADRVMAGGTMRSLDGRRQSDRVSRVAGRPAMAVAYTAGVGNLIGDLSPGREAPSHRNGAKYPEPRQHRIHQALTFADPGRRHKSSYPHRRRRRADCRLRAQAPMVALLLLSSESTPPEADAQIAGKEAGRVSVESQMPSNREHGSLFANGR